LPYSINRFQVGITVTRHLKSAAVYHEKNKIAPNDTENRRFCLKFIAKCGERAPFRLASFVNNGLTLAVLGNKSILSSPYKVGNKKQL